MHTGGSATHLCMVHTEVRDQFLKFYARVCLNVVAMFQVCSQVNNIGYTHEEQKLPEEAIYTSNKNKALNQV